MWYFFLYFIIAIWVFNDAKNRLNHILVWPISTFILGPIILPFYFSKRNLKLDEIREGGTAWNVLKNFSILWTITMFIGIITGMVNVGEMSGSARTGAEQAGLAIGASLGIGMMFMLWFFMATPALVLGLLLKKSSIVEKGPTGALAVSLAGGDIDGRGSTKLDPISEEIIEKGKEVLDSMKPFYEKVVTKHANSGESVTDTLGDMASTLGSRISDISHTAKEKSKELFENLSEKKTASERLEELQKLKDSGLITEEEFQEKKKQVLSNL